MKEKDLLDLIDEYLLGRIRPDDLARLEYLRKTNPEIDEKVNQSIVAFRVLQYARYKQIRQKLHQIDAAGSGPTKGDGYSKWIFRGIFLILLFAGLWLFAIKLFSPASLAERYFEIVSTEIQVNIKFNEEELHNWELASRSFKDQDFANAIDLFQPFMENQDQNIIEQAQWNILLARLGLHGPDENWIAGIQKFESSAPDYLKPNITGLLSTIDSPFYKLFILIKIPHLASLKPSLM